MPWLYVTAFVQRMLKTSPQHRVEGHEPLSAEDATQLKAALPSFLLFAITWSIGATCDKTGRIAFDLFLRSKAAGESTRSCQGLTHVCHNLQSLHLPFKSMFAASILHTNSRFHDPTLPLPVRLALQE